MFFVNVKKDTIFDCHMKIKFTIPLSLVLTSKINLLPLLNNIISNPVVLNLTSYITANNIINACVIISENKNFFKFLIA